MRVLHFYKTFAPDSFGGAQSVIRDIARGTEPFGVETQVLSLSRDPDGNSMHVDGVWARKARLHLELASTGLSLSVLSVFKEMAQDADLIHYHFPWPMMDVIHFLSRTDKPAVVTYHSDIVKQRWLKAAYGPLMHRFLDSVEGIIATSPPYLETSPVLARHRDKVTVIPIGTGDIARRELPESRRAYWRERLGPPCATTRASTTCSRRQQRPGFRWRSSGQDVDRNSSPTPSPLESSPMCIFWAKCPRTRRRCCSTWPTASYSPRICVQRRVGLHC